MRAIIVLCLIAAASADKLGYNYQPVAHADEGLSFTPGVAAAPAAEQHAAVQHGEAVLSQPIIEAPAAAAPAVQQVAQAETTPQVQQAPLIEEYQKEYYSYAAPDDQFDDADANEQISGALKKSLRVVFIRTPENRGLETAALQLAKQSGEDRTAIYVLSKQTDITNLAKQLQGLKSESRSKPEVHFVKYRTPEDAANAQLAIQNQYNQLPGNSRISNEGTAPVLNFASQTPAAAAPVARSPANEYLPANAVPQQDYLPPSLRRFRVK